MKRKLILTGTIIAAFVLALAVGLTWAQGPEPPGEGVQPQDVGIAAAVLNRIPIQGRLTDASGNPLNGTYTINFYLYDAATGGNLVCFDAIDNNVPVNNGLFQWEIWGSCVSGTITGQQLYLELRVEGETLSPRQPIYPVPYAWSLRPGAVISDTSPSAVLKVVNTGSGPALKAEGSGIIQSTAVSRIFVPGAEAVPHAESRNNLVMRYYGRGTVVITSTNTTDPQKIVIPVQIPAVLYGQPVRIYDMRVHYRTSNSASYIDETYLYRQTLDGGYTEVISSTANFTSTTFTYYHTYCSAGTCQLGDDASFLTVLLQLRFASTAHEITIGGVRLTLEHD